MEIGSFCRIVICSSRGCPSLKQFAINSKKNLKIFIQTSDWYWLRCPKSTFRHPSFRAEWRWRLSLLKDWRPTSRESSQTSLTGILMSLLTLAYRILKEPEKCSMYKCSSRRTAYLYHRHQSTQETRTEASHWQREQLVRMTLIVSLT